MRLTERPKPPLLREEEALRGVRIRRLPSVHQDFTRFFFAARDDESRGVWHSDPEFRRNEEKGQAEAALITG